MNSLTVKAPVTQLPPASGPLPTATQLLLSAMLHADLDTVRAVPVAPDDLDEPHALILDAVQACAETGHTGPCAVETHLRRTGQGRDVHYRELVNVYTAGGQPLAWPVYAAAILADRLRDVAEGVGNGLIEQAAHGSEQDLWDTLVDGGRRVRELRDRLTTARGHAGEVEAA